MIEAAVPISSRIEGTTDFLIGEGETGFLCAAEDHTCFARHAATLEKDRSRLARMRGAVAAAAHERFSNTKAVSAYADLFRSVMATAQPPASPRPWQAFRVDPNFAVSWQRRIERKLKVMIGV